jgi:hypothetical protein
MILLTIRMLRGGAEAVTGSRVALAALAGTVAAGTRAPGVLVVAVCCLTLLVCLRRERRGWVAAAVIGGIPAAATAWFYLRNLRLYGDFTGQGALLEKFERARLETWSDVPGIPGLWPPVTAAWIPLTLMATVVPYVVVRRVVRRARNGVLWSWRPDPAWTLLVAHALLTLVNLVGFVRAGGGFHDRYLMTAMPLIATVSALAMLSIRRPGLKAVDGPSAPTRRREWRVAARWSVLLVVWLVVAFGYRETFHLVRTQDRYPVEGPVPVLLLALAASLAVLVVVVMFQRAGTPVARRVEAHDAARRAA